MSLQNSQQISDIKTMLVKGMNGEGIESIEKTATEGFIDTYTITYTDGTKTTFDVTNGNWGIWTPAVTAAASATSVTINNDSIVPTSILEVFSQNASGTVITVNDIDVSAGAAVLSFPALAEATSFIIHVINGTASGGGGGGGTSDYPDLTNKPQINGVTLVGNKPSSDFGLQNIFQGTIAEWNALTTAEKKAYDHASITGTGGGEYNVNRTTGSLEQTAGMPSEYPATQVMLSDNVTSVEDRIGNILFVEKTISNVSISMAWGSMFLGSESVNISDLGLNNAPDVISATFSSTAAPVALCLVSGVTKNVVPVSLVRAVSGTVSGKIMLMLKSNG